MKKNLIKYFLITSILLLLSYILPLIILVAFISIYRLLNTNDISKKHKGIIYFISLFIFLSVSQNFILNYDYPLYICLCGILFLTILYFIPFLLALLFKKVSFIIFILGIIITEYYIQYISINNPLIQFAYYLAEYPKLIQWYSYTGFLGGTLFILLFNLFLYYILFSNRKKIKLINALFCLLLITISFLSYIFSNKKNENKSENKRTVLVVNTLKDSTISFNNVLDCFENQKDTSVDYIVFPESSLFFDLDNSFKFDPSVTRLIRVLNLNYNDAKIIIGIRFKDKDNRHNQVLMIDKNWGMQIHKKQLFAPFGEVLPFKCILQKIPIFKPEKFHNYLADKDTTPLFLNKNDIIFSPICYEAYSHDNISEKIRNSAQTIFVVSSDVDFNKSFEKLALRFFTAQSISFNKYIVKSANKGVSFVLDNNGNCISQTKYNKLEIIKNDIYLNNNITFYCKYGNIIAFFSIFILSLLLITKLKHRNL